MFISDIFTADLAQLCRAMGLVGFALYVLAFLLLSVGRLDSRGIPYFALNLAAALCVVVSLAVDFNLSAALIQGFYAIISLIAIGLRICRRDRSETRSNPRVDPGIASQPAP